jgi:hypothetical protein
MATTTKGWRKTAPRVHRCGRWKRWEGRKVNTVLASDVEYIQLVHFPSETLKMTVLQSKIVGLKEKTFYQSQNEQNSNSRSRAWIPFKEWETGTLLQAQARDLHGEGLCVAGSWGDKEGKLIIQANFEHKQCHHWSQVSRNVKGLIIVTSWNITLERLGIHCYLSCSETRGSLPVQAAWLLRLLWSAWRSDGIREFHVGE